MRISDWSSDVCSSDLDERDRAIGLGADFELEQHFVDLVADLVGADVELYVDRRLRARRTLEDAGGVRILERQILDVLRDHAGGGRGVRAVRLHSFLRGCPDFGHRDTFLRLERWLR